jgi:diguanylate cyclase (GGDEF)-like protein/PAS domain S-box-containing protein
MTLRNRAKLLLRYQTIGIFLIMVVTIGSVFSYFLLKDNFNHKSRLNTLDQEIISERKISIQREAQNTKDYILYVHSQAEKRLKEQTKTSVERAIAIANNIYTQQKRLSSDAQIKDLIIATLKDMRFFNGRGYYFINQLDSTMLMNPNAPLLLGRKLTDNNAFNSIKESINNQQMAGFSYYKWQQQGAGAKLKQKISYSKVFTTYNWIIGAGDYIDSFEDDLRQTALDRVFELKSPNGIDINIIDTDQKIIGSSMHNTNDLIHDDGSASLLLNDIVNFAKQGSGFINYSQLPNQHADTNNRLAYIELLPELDWIIITDISPNSVDLILMTQQALLEQNSDKDIRILLIALAITALISSIMIYFYSLWNKRLFQNYQRNIEIQQSEIKQHTKELKLASRVFESSNDAILVTNSNHIIIAANPASTRITGYQINKLVGKDAQFLSSDKQDQHFHNAARKHLKEHGYWQGEVWNKKENGDNYLTWLTISTSSNQENTITNYICIFSDISEKKKAEQQLSYLADYDPLTKLAKKHLIAEKVNNIIAGNHPECARSFALILINIDRFKNVNDSLGHNIGDIILQRIAQRLSHNIRSSDLISRLSGDEFIILVNNDKAKAASTLLARRILRDLAEPIKAFKHDLIVTPSIGISLFPDNGRDFDALLKNADAALHFTKAHGRNDFQFFTIDMHIKASEKLTIERDLREALRTQQFELYYQAQFDLSTDTIIGCEALIRWNCPGVGTIPPDKFIPIAEESGLIIPIGQWVLDEACRQGVKWQQQGLNLVPIAVNVSCLQLKNNIVESIKMSLSNSTLEAKWLQIEITESALIDDSELTRRTLKQLKTLGLKIALDDFGTGYSSLAYLKRFPIDKLKIDKAFIKDLPGDSDDLAITRSILDIANNLNMITIAEGVETAQQQQLLRSMGCEQMQGYLKARPLPADEYARLHL